MEKEPAEQNPKEPKKIGSLFSSLLKNGTADGAAGFGIAGVIMIAAAVIWTISSRRNGNASYSMYSFFCLAVGVYCLVNMLRTIKKNQDKKGKGK